MKRTCSACGGSEALRFRGGEWVCYHGCGLTNSPKPAVQKKPWKRDALFLGYWFQDGHRMGRASRKELATAYRIWANHKDIREGRFL